MNRRHQQWLDWLSEQDRSKRPQEDFKLNRFDRYHRNGVTRMADLYGEWFMQTDFNIARVAKDDLRIYIPNMSSKISQFCRHRYLRLLRHGFNNYEGNKSGSSHTFLFLPDVLAKDFEEMGLGSLEEYLRAKHPLTITLDQPKDSVWAISTINKGDREYWKGQWFRKEDKINEYKRLGFKYDCDIEAAIVSIFIQEATKFKPKIKVPTLRAYSENPKALRNQIADEATASAEDVIVTPEHVKTAINARFHGGRLLHSFKTETDDGGWEWIITKLGQELGKPVVKALQGSKTLKILKSDICKVTQVIVKGERASGSDAFPIELKKNGKAKPAAAAVIAAHYRKLEFSVRHCMAKEIHRLNPSTSMEVLMMPEHDGIIVDRFVDWPTVLETVHRDLGFDLRMKVVDIHTNEFGQASMFGWKQDDGSWQPVAVDDVKQAGKLVMIHEEEPKLNSAYRLGQPDFDALISVFSKKFAEAMVTKANKEVNKKMVKFKRPQGVIKQQKEAVAGHVESSLDQLETLAKLKELDQMFAKPEKSDEPISPKDYVYMDIGYTDEEIEHLELDAAEEWRLQSIADREARELEESNYGKQLAPTGETMDAFMARQERAFVHSISKTSGKKPDWL